MADVRPFRGIRYNDARYPDLSALLAPPYDVISSDQHHRLRELSDRNVVRLILPERWPDDSDSDAKYQPAAELLEQWLDDETLVQDSVPAIYILDQEFESGGQPRTRRAFIARSRIEPFGTGRIFPHEDTMPGPKADRLALMRATRMNMCQVLGLYQDDGQAAALLAETADIDPVATGTGIDGVRNSLRAVYHPKLIARLGALMADKRVVIADGHHRYETAVAYRDLMRVRFPLGVDRPHEFVAMALVATFDPGLVIHPTHRLVKGLKGFSAAALFERAAEAFELEEIPTDAAAIINRLAALADRHAFGIVTPDGSRILIRKSGRRDPGAAVQNLDTYILHHELLLGLLNLGPDTWQKGGPIHYAQDADDCVRAVQSANAVLAALVNPTRIDEVESVAFAGSRLPPKSTFFLPKLPTGLVINPLV